MADTRADNIIFLKDARTAVLQLSEYKAQLQEQDLQTKRLEKGLAAEKKAVNDSIDLTIRKRKAEITSSYDTEIEQTLAQLKKIKARREKAKSRGMKERMEVETSELQEENRKLHTEIKTLFRQNGVPGFCNSLFFYALYYTRGIKELLVFLITLLICFLVIPVGIYHLIGTEKTLWLIVIYLLDILIFGGIYFVINNRIKVYHHETLRQGRKIRNQIRANAKKMHAIKNGIRKDKNEDMYDLADYDDEIAKLEAEKTDIANQKQHALTNFENTGKVLISKEIMDNNRERLEQLEADAADAAQLLGEVQAKVKAQTLTVTEQYEPLLGREFLQAEKIERLLEAFEVGGAANITEAQDMVRAGKRPMNVVPEKTQ